MEQTEVNEQDGYTLIVRKPNFGLPTACPVCLPVLIYLKLAQFPFRLDFNSSYPDSDQIPFFESGTYVAYNDENGGVIQRLNEERIVDLDAEFSTVPEWISMKAVVESWLADAVLYELWVGSDGGCARKIYHSDLPWLIGKALFIKQRYDVMNRLGITKENAAQREEEILKRAKLAYGALSSRCGEQEYLFGTRPSSLDAYFVGHALFTLHAFPETSVLRSTLLDHGNLVSYAQKLEAEFLNPGTSSPSGQQSQPASSYPRYPSNSGSRPNRRPKKEKTEEEKKFSRRAKYFLVAQLVAVLLFVSVLGGYDVSEVENDDDGESMGYY